MAATGGRTSSNRTTRCLKVSLQGSISGYGLKPTLPLRRLFDIVRALLYQLRELVDRRLLQLHHTAQHVHACRRHAGGIARDGPHALRQPAEAAGTAWHAARHASRALLRHHRPGRRRGVGRERRALALARWLAAAVGG